MFEHKNRISHEPPIEYFKLFIRSTKCLHELWHNFGIFFITLTLSFKILIFKLHMIASIRMFKQKSDITRATYEHFSLLIRSCKCLHELWHNFGIFFIIRPLSFKILNFKSYMIACSMSFDSHV